MAEAVDKILVNSNGAGSPRPERFRLSLGLNRFANRKLSSSLGALALVVAGLFLAASFWIEELLARAFCLGAFSTALLGASVAYIVAGYSGLRAKLPGTSKSSSVGGPVAGFVGHYRSIFELAPVPMLELDDTGRVLGANMKGTEWMRQVQTNERYVSRPFNYLDRLPVEDWETMAEALQRAVSGEAVEVHHRYRMGEGLRSIAARLVSVDSALFGQPRLVAILDDVTDAEQRAESLAMQAKMDSLTDLVNRREFEQRLARVLDTARSDQSEHALCYLDLDRFKTINDTCGHRAGDEMLRQLARVLQSGVRRRDTLARLGGDEFVILMERCSLQQATRVAESLVELVSDYRFAWASNSFSVGVSIGVVSVTADAQDVASVIGAADEACYQAKVRGRNRVYTWAHSGSIASSSTNEASLFALVQDALQDGLFELWTQEIRPLAAGPRAAGSGHSNREVFIRMHGHDGEVLLPGAFLPLAQRSGLGAQIDRWVLSAVAARLTSEVDGGSDATRAGMWFVNLSLDTIQDEAFVDALSALVHGGGLRPERLCFEIRETDALANLSAAIKFAERLHRLGCGVVLEGVGSSPSSLLHLRELEPEYLKLDGVLVRQLTSDAGQRIVVRAVVELAASMSRQVIAQQVEDEATLDTLRQLGVHYVQGHVICVPKAMVE